jgi:hypothetical protein
MHEIIPLSSLASLKEVSIGCYPDPFESRLCSPKFPLNIIFPSKPTSSYSPLLLKFSDRFPWLPNNLCSAFKFQSVVASFLIHSDYLRLPRCQVFLLSKKWGLLEPSECPLLIGPLQPCVFGPPYLPASREPVTLYRLFLLPVHPCHYSDTSESMNMKAVCPSEISVSK